MSDRTVIDLIQINIGRLNLTEDSSEALFALARDPHGFEQKAIPAFFASALSISVERANDIVVDLLGRQLLSRIEGVHGPRITTNYEALGIDESRRAELIRYQQPFELRGEPHSEMALKSLASFFLETDGPIYLGLEMTSVHIFDELEKRAESNKRTVFLIPRRRQFSKEQRSNYDEVLHAWVRRLRKGTPKLRNNVELRITKRAHPELYTSAIGQQYARFDIYSYETRTTLSGNILQVKSDTSLYQLILRRYQEAYRFSCPLWKMSLIAATYHWLKLSVFPVVLLFTAIVLGNVNKPIAYVGSAIATGLFVWVLKSLLGDNPWKLPRLF